MVLQRRGFTRKIGEHFLRGLLRHIGAPMGPSQRRCIDEIEMSPDQFGKGQFIVRLDVPAKEFGISGHPESKIQPLAGEKPHSFLFFHFIPPPDRWAQAQVRIPTRPQTRP